MAGILESLRNGTWVTRERTRFVALAVLAAFAIAFGYLVTTAEGVVDWQGRPIGTDFSNVYAAGTLVLEGRPEAPFDPALQHEREQAIFGPATPFYGWHYPPFFLFIAGVLALMPYALALAVWQAGTFALYLLSIRSIVAGAGPAAAPIVRDPFWILLAAAFPAVFVNLGHGHNGFLTATLLGTALLLLDRRPIVSGALFGLIAYKPQFGLMIPLVLAATGRWRTIAAAAATVAALVLAATAAFGLQVWDAFLASTRLTRILVLEAGDTGWHKIQSIFSWVRMWGGTVGTAYLIQGASVVALGASLVWLWRSAVSYPLKAAALTIGAILATPYSLDYDLMVLAPALAFLAADGFARGFLPWEKTSLAILWIVPLVARSVAQWTLLPLGLIAMLAVFALVLRRAVIDIAATGRTSSHVTP
jgi:alpha-1,2-mannosyltransferase